MESLITDARFALRLLVRSPGFTFAALLSLALGLGATTAIFSLVDGVLLRAPPYPDAARLTMVWSSVPARKLDQVPSSYPDFLSFRDESKSFDAMAAYLSGDFNLSLEGTPELVPGASIAGDLNKVLGVQPLLGRGFLAEEATAGKNHVALLSHGLWKRRFGGDPAVIGKTVTLDAASFTVVGVLPPQVDFPAKNVGVWVPLVVEPNSRMESRRNHMLLVVGRLKAGVTLERARTELQAITAHLGEQFPEAAGLSAALVSLHESRSGNVRSGLLVLLGAVLSVLLIACANVANLLLNRGVRRQRELAIRAALGATRGRLVRQLLTESVLLAVLGGAAGIGLAFLAMGSARAFIPPELAQLEGVGIDGRILAFSFGLSLVTGLVFGLLPALGSSRVALIDSLKETAPSAAGPGGQRLRGALVAAEVALALALLVGAGLLLHSLQKTLAVDPGFQPAGVLTFNIALPEQKYRKATDSDAFYQGLLERISGLPGVEAAGATTSLPMDGKTWRMPLSVEGHAEPPNMKFQDVPLANFRLVAGDYFKAMKISMVKGRAFGPEDVPGGGAVALINEAAARQFFPGEEPVGKQIWMGPPERLLPPQFLAQFPGGHIPRITVVGVARDTRSTGLRNPPVAEVFASTRQNDERPRSMSLAIRTAGDPTRLVPLIRNLLGEVDRDQPLADVRTMEERLSSSLVQPRFQAFLVTVFASVALALAMIGVSGVVGYSVSQRMREFGIRLALGATSGHIFRQVLRQGGTWVGIGVVVGLGGAVGVTRLLQGMLFDVGTLDPLTHLVALVGLVGAALLALYFPARRAMRVDPIICMRME